MKDQIPNIILIIKYSERGIIWKYRIIQNQKIADSILFSQNLVMRKGNLCSIPNGLQEALNGILIT